MKNDPGYIWLILKGIINIIKAFKKLSNSIFVAHYTTQKLMA